MPRIARKDSQSCYYHIMIQGINREYIFEKEEYIKEFQKIIIKKLEESKVIILAYCIMNNHAHFLIYSEKSEYLSKYMQKVNTSYSQFYNNAKKRVGYVFRDRYRSQEIMSSQQLYTCLRYIHNNPVKADIVKKMEDYKYSSYTEFINRSARKIINEDGIKLIFGTKKGFEEQFYYIHRQYCSEENLLEVKEKSIEEVIGKIESKYNKKIDILKENRKILEEIIKEAREQTDIKIVELARILDMSKSKVWTYTKK